MNIAENYSFIAIMADGSEMVKGGDLTNCIKFTLIPKSGTNLPEHNFFGIKMQRRFCRSFNRYSMVNQTVLPGLLNWQNGSNIITTTEDLSTIVDVGSKIAKNATNQQWWTVNRIEGNTIELTQIYLGRTQQIGSKMALEPKQSEYLHCIICEGFRIYVKSSNGEFIITPEDYELYL